MSAETGIEGIEGTVAREAGMSTSKSGSNRACCSFDGAAGSDGLLGPVGTVEKPSIDWSDLLSSFGLGGWGCGGLVE